MLDTDLAALYDVRKKMQVRAVKRNIERFPADFIFQRSAEEWANLRSQTVTSNTSRSDRRTASGKKAKRARRQAIERGNEEMREPAPGQRSTRSDKRGGHIPRRAAPKGNQPPRGAAQYTE
jgi:hypothetical protein